MNDSREDPKTRRSEESGNSPSPASSFPSAPLRAFAPSREPSLNIEGVSAIIVDCAYRLHVEVGPGLLETVYEAVLAKMLTDRGLRVHRQVPVPIQVFGLAFDEGFRADLLVHDLVLVELKSVEVLAPVHGKQVLTCLRLLKMPLGLLINFGAATFKEGSKRIVNDHRNFASSRLRVNQQTTRP
jgi:GxxExxY protein